MEKEHVDPVYEYVDRNTKLLKRELRSLKKDIGTLARALLRTQRFLAETQAYSEANACREKIRADKVSHRNLAEQLTAKLTLTIKEIGVSTDPLSVAFEFTRWCISEQKKLGIEFISLPD